MSRPLIASLILAAGLAAGAHAEEASAPPTKPSQPAGAATKSDGTTSTKSAPTAKSAPAGDAKSATKSGPAITTEPKGLDKAALTPPAEVKGAAHSVAPKGSTKAVAKTAAASESHGRHGHAARTASAAEAPAEVVPAGPPSPVYCGSFTPFNFRVTAVGKDPSTRANQAMDVINKYLGGRMGKVTTQAAGKNVRLLLNNELLAVITPADAAVERQKTAGALAEKWAHILSTAFEASKAQR